MISPFHFDYYSMRNFMREYFGLFISKFLRLTTIECDKHELVHFKLVLHSN